jgi:hypothetical protein
MYPIEGGIFASEQPYSCRGKYKLELNPFLSWHS